LHIADDNVQVLNINVYLSHQDGKPKHRRKLLAPEKLTFLGRGTAKSAVRDLFLLVWMV